MNGKLTACTVALFAVVSVSDGALTVEQLPPADTAGVLLPSAGSAALDGDDGSGAAPELSPAEGVAGADSVLSPEGIVDGAVSPDQIVPSALPASPAVVRPATQAELRRMSEAELFALAFGRAAPERPRQLIYIMFVDGRSTGNTEVVYDENFSDFRFISPLLGEYLDAVIIPDDRAEAGDSAGYFTASVLTAAGYDVSVDERMHEMRIDIPPGKKVLQRLNLKGGYVWQPRGERVKPAFFSLYMNYTASEMLAYSSVAYNVAGIKFSRSDFSRAPLYVSCNGAAAMLKWTLEGSAWAREPVMGEPFTSDNYRRGDARLVREFVPRHSRLTLGDVYLSFGGRAVGGARYEYNEGLFGNNPQDDESTITFFMPRAGTVEVYMDGIYRQRFNLPAGRHEVRGFGGETGRNSVRLMLRMEDGSVEEVPFEYIQAPPGNMRKGESRVSAVVGVRRDAVPRPLAYDYDPQEPALSYDYLYGLTHTVSLGVTGLSSPFNNVMLAQTAFNFGRFGRMSLQGGANFMPGSGAPAGQYVNVSYSPNISPGIIRLNRQITGRLDGGPLPNIGLSARGYYSTAAYNPDPFSDTERENRDMAGVSGNLGFGFLRGSISMGGGVTFNRETETDAVAGAEHHPIDYNYGVRLSQRLLGVAMSASAGINFINGVKRPYFSTNMGRGFGVGAGLSRSYGKHRLSASASAGVGLSYTPLIMQEILPADTLPYEEGPQYEVALGDSVNSSVSGSAGANWNWSSGGYGAGSRSYSANFTMRDVFNLDIPEVRATLMQNHNRAALNAGYGMTMRNTYFAETQYQYVNTTLSGSFMFADGLWAFGRPVSGGFVLIDARNSLAGSKVHVDRSHYYRQDHSHNGWLGAAYKTGVSAHTNTPITLTLTDAPYGAILENNRFYVTGGYKQGYALRIGSRDGIMVQTRLRDGARPLSYTYVRVEREDDPGELKLATFTGGDGTLQLGDLAPGTVYRLSFGSAVSIKEILIEVPKNAAAILELPDITVVRE
ncbi:MAG: hypothetical protein FWC23_09420 [Chitinispirillia bacterium]|nr:hypothetical protein [Chitinispirillia bacterium]MCL2269387.1 hypothetical protein [Chitinispirillia bacterium]